MYGKDYSVFCIFPDIYDFFNLVALQLHGWRAMRAWFWSSDISFSVIKVCSTTSSIELKYFRSDCTSRHDFDMMVSMSSNNDSSSTVLGSKRSDWYPQISGLGLATSTWPRASKISYRSKHLLHAAPCDSHVVTTAITKWSAFIPYAFWISVRVERFKAL